jgi:glycosyltransferase involved in cell wall biosynthesis
MPVKPKVTVVIPTFNSAGLLPEAINSVLEQKFRDFEIILVDDGSTDNTHEVVSDYRSKLTYVYQKNMGVAAARNRGIQMARGDYLVFLDADDVLLPNKLGEQVDFFQKHPDVDLLFSEVNCFTVNDKGVEKQWPYPSPICRKIRWDESLQYAEILAIQNLFPPVSVMVRRQSVIDAGGFDEDRDLMPLADWDLWYRLGHNGIFAYQREVLAKYRVSENSMSRNRPTMKLASRKLERKIKGSGGFNLLSDHFHSDFYFYWGVQWLDYGEPQLALDRLSLAIQLNPRNWLARFAYLITRLVGSDAVIFYHLKRRFLGPWQNLGRIKI